MTATWTHGVRRAVLPNGLTLLAQADPAAPAVSVVSHVRAGFFDEPDRWVGLSHVLEHMLFKGTPTRGVGEIARETKAAGGYLNAGTGYDHTTYYTVLPARALAVALELQSDALLRSLLDDAELRRELRVIVEEAKRKLDTPAAVAAETLHAELFDIHRIRRWRIGTEAQLARFTRDDVLAYYRSRYVPSRTIVAMVGDLDPEDALARAEGVFGGWPASEPAHDPSPPEPPRRTIRARTLRGDVAQAELVVGWRAVPALHADATALDLAAAVLGSGRGSWLYRALRAPGLVTSIGVSHYSPTEVGVFSISADLDPNRLADSLDALGAELARLRETGPGGGDLERVRTLLRTRWARRLESTEGRAAALAQAEALGGYRLLDEEFGRLLESSAAEVRDAAARWLDPAAAAAVVYLPQGRGEDLTVQRLAAALSRGPGSPHPTPPLAVLPDPPAGTGGWEGRIEAGVLHVPLPGVDLLVRRKPGVPLLTLGVYRRRARFDQPARCGLAALAVRAAVRGAGDLDQASLAFAVERLGGTLASSVAPDWFGYATTVLADHAAAAAALLDLVLRVPRFDDQDLVRERDHLAEEAAQVADDMLRYPFQLALGAAFGDAGYGLPSGGLPETIVTLTPDDARHWHASELGSGRTVVVAVGDVEPDRLVESLAGRFAGLAAMPLQAAPEASPPFDPSPAAPRVRAVTRARKQTALAMAFGGPSRRSDDRHAASVWAAMAGGLGGRLFEALRERRSLAYAVLAASWQRAGAGLLLTYLGTSPEREEEAREAMLEELARFRDEPPPGEEVTRAASYLAGQAEVERQTGAAVAGEIAEAWLTGTGLGELEDPGAAYRAVTAEQVHRLLEECLDPTRRVEGVVRGT